MSGTRQVIIKEKVSTFREKDTIGRLTGVETATDGRITRMEKADRLSTIRTTKIVEEKAQEETGEITVQVRRRRISRAMIATLAGTIIKRITTDQASLN
jgi:hypothetical protein